METHQTTHDEPTTRGPALNALAVVGFIALILIGMALAIYAARFIPTALSGIGEAAVSLSHVFAPSTDDTGVVVVPTTDTNYQNQNTTGATSVTIPDTATTQNPATTPAAPVPATTYTPPTYYSAPTYRVVTVPASTGYTGTYYGDPDLTIDILAIGYLRRSGDINSFVEDDRIPDNRDGAVKYRITNRGTNVSGRFDVDIRVRTHDGTDTDTVRAPSMQPGTSIESYGSFDSNVSSGSIEITLTVDPTLEVRESNERNNDDSDTIRIR